MIKIKNRLAAAGLIGLFLFIAASPALAIKATIPKTAADALEKAMSKSEFSDWGISQFNSDLVIRPDSKIDVTETITADFTNAWNKHGIYRYIPISYEDKNYQRMNIRFSLISVTDEKGNPYEVETTHEGDDINLKIGSADTIVSGQIKTYIIRYKLDRGINQFPDHDELFWNTTGNGWDVPISHSTTTVTIPEGADKSALKAICYTGAGYSTAQDCTSEVIDNNTFRFRTNSSLWPEEGISVAVSFPRDLVTFPPPLTILMWFIQDNWGYLIPFFVLLFCLYSWNRNGRDPRATHPTIMPEYEAPDKLSPAEIGTLLDDRVDMQDITSCIIDLATRGYLKIIESKTKQFIGEKTNYTLEKIADKSITDLKPFEQKIFNGLFAGDATSVDMEDLKYKFYKHIAGIQKSIYGKLVSDKYYVSNPETVRKQYMGIGGIMVFLILFVLAPFLFNWSISLFFGLLISSLIIMGFSVIMPKKTQRGVDTYIHILGLEEFIKTAETDRLKFYEKENIFEKILPYAIALGLADKWAKACEGLTSEPPSWYTGASWNHFSTHNLLYSLNRFNHNLGSTLSSAPRSSASHGSSGFSSGGGFSGGGFGGGGGGSW